MHEIEQVLPPALAELVSFMEDPLEVIMLRSPRRPVQPLRVKLAIRAFRNSVPYTRLYGPAHEIARRLADPFMTTNAVIAAAVGLGNVMVGDDDVFPRHITAGGGAQGPVGDLTAPLGDHRMLPGPGPCQWRLLHKGLPVGTWQLAALPECTPTSIDCQDTSCLAGFVRILQRDMGRGDYMFVQDFESAKKMGFRRCLCTEELWFSK